MLHVCLHQHHAVVVKHENHWHLLKLVKKHFRDTIHDDKKGVTAVYELQASKFNERTRPSLIAVSIHWCSRCSFSRNCRRRAGYILYSQSSRTTFTAQLNWKINDLIRYQQTRMQWRTNYSFFECEYSQYNKLEWSWQTISDQSSSLMFGGHQLYQKIRISSLF